MKTGFFRSLAAMALLVCAAFATHVYDVIVVPVLKAYQTVKRVLVGWATSALALAAKTDLDLNPISIFASAKAFYLRLAKRERPRVTPGWRWCPST